MNMTIDEKIAICKEKAHNANEAAIKYNNEVHDAYEEMNTLIQEKYIPLVGKAFKGRDYMIDRFNGSLHPPVKPFFVYSLPPIGWNRSGMVFNEYQLPVLKIITDNEPYGVEAPTLAIDTLYTHAFEAEDVYAEFTKDYEEISIEEFQKYVNEVFASFIAEVKDNAEHFISTEGDE